jgi:hypothetical protein
MLYALLKSPGHPISQVSRSGPAVPLSLLLSIILPSSCSQTSLPPFYHYSIPKYTHHLPFYNPTCSPISFFLNLLPLPYFRLFWTIYGWPPATSTSPHIYTLYLIVFPYPPPHAWPIPFPCPCLLPYSPFSLLCPFMDAFPYMSTFYHVLTCTHMICSNKQNAFDRFFVLQ